MVPTILNIFLVSQIEYNFIYKFNLIYIFADFSLGFANFIAYIINREIDLANHLDEFSPQSLVMNGVFGNGEGVTEEGYGEHIVQIKLNYKGYTDLIEWDICNPYN